ncbi:Negative regulator of differentiation 1 [Cyphellophora attinorum]|uniref:Negative regulator of differentiation 1 n=1 Tax=Cyphellophora attinorum TaxID=1664694 RepID=A0A0N0NMC3_9EURO|nr:Negative regulator of differentiation 1 [Phialophora attinorum]KPI40188.1 Negative regulator of differentiation 1 [Phialophora attinorum]
MMNGNTGGFSQAAFNGNVHGYGGFGDRNMRKGAIPAINTANKEHLNAGEQTPGTAFDMSNFTPLLPSQLLLGSPFQPGSPGAFQSPQFQTTSRFSAETNGLHQHQYQQNGQMSSPTQGQAPSMSPTMYQGLMSPDPFSPQSPTGFSGLGGAAFGSYPTMMQSASMMSSTSRTVYLGNVPGDTTAEELLSHVRSGPIESVRMLLDKNCAFISFLDSSSATHFHSDAILKKLSIKGQDIKIGWGKPSQVPSSVQLAVQQSGASRNVYVGNLPDDITEQEIRDDLSKFGPIDTIKMVREKNIGFVHFLSVSNAIKAVAQLPQDPKWQAPRRVYYGKDRIAPGYAHVLNGADRDLISNALAQQSVAAAAVATTAGGVNNLGNRTIYLGNIHPETTIEEICNVVRGGRLKIGWGKHSGALPPAIALAVSGGASRNVYIGNLDESWSEERLRQDFSEYGEIELVNTLREKSCAFVNFTNIANAIKAIEGMRGREEYKRFKINFGKDRCGNPPRQNINNVNAQPRMQAGLDMSSSPPPMNGFENGLSQTGSSPTRPTIPTAPRAFQQPHRQQSQPAPATNLLNGGQSNPLTMYLHQMSQQQAQAEQDMQDDSLTFAALQHQQNQALANQQASLYGGETSNGHVSLEPPPMTSHARHQSSLAGLYSTGSSMTNGASTTVGGLLAPTNSGLGASRSAHSRAVSLPAFSQEIFGPSSQTTSSSRPFGGHAPQGSFSGFGSAFGTGFGTSGFNGLGLTSDRGGLSGWAEEEIGAK